MLDNGLKFTKETIKMEQEILNILSTYGVEAIMIALLINLLTGFIKKPIKAYSQKSGRDLNKFISLVPVVLGFIAAVIYYLCSAGFKNIKFENIFTLALSSASLSLAVFAVYEKFFPKKKADDGSDTESDKNDINIVLNAAKKIEASSEPAVVNEIEIKVDTNTAAVCANGASEKLED